jgi:membrane protein involved in colicin uptake
VEAIMAEHSSMHFYLNWAKERIDGMDAALASLEAKAGHMQAKMKDSQLIADLKNQRDAFQDTVRQQAKAGEAAWERTKAQLEPRWNSLEAQMKPYIDTVSKQIEQQKVVLRDVAAAQAKTWRETADKFNDVATKFTAERRAELEAAVRQMRANAEADARVQKLKQAGSESWTALSAAMVESRKALERANQAAWDALGRSAPPKT